jgi:hypothetical protein
MSALGSMSNRDVIALGILLARAIAGEEHSEETEHEVIAAAFRLADEFVAQSQGHWAIGARANAPGRKPRTCGNSGAEKTRRG